MVSIEVDYRYSQDQLEALFRQAREEGRRTQWSFRYGLSGPEYLDASMEQSRDAG